MLVRRCTVGLMLLAGTELLLQGAEREKNKRPARDAPTIISKALLPLSLREGTTLRSLSFSERWPLCKLSLAVMRLSKWLRVPSRDILFHRQNGTSSVSQAFCFVCFFFFYPPRSSAKVSGALLASGPFSWKLQLGYAAVYHTALVTSLSSPLAALVSLGAAPP